MGMKQDEARESSDPSDFCDEPDAVPIVVDAHVLFDGRREICLELNGVRYRLRITRRNKLILQK
jgi:hemin uptake protein HemP